MRYMLSVINEADKEYEVDAEFDSMASILSYVEQHGYAWSSLVIIVLPKDNSTGTSRHIS